MSIRFHIQPGDVPAAIAARRLGLTEAAFRDRLPLLLARGFPPADPTTGNWDLDAINEWRRRRYPELFLTQPSNARDAHALINDRLARSEWLT